VIDSPLLTFPAGHVHPRIFFCQEGLVPCFRYGDGIVG